METGHMGSKLLLLIRYKGRQKTDVDLAQTPRKKLILLCLVLVLFGGCGGCILTHPYNVTKCESCGAYTQQPLICTCHKDLDQHEEESQ